MSSQPSQPSDTDSPTTRPTALIVGASRGLGHAIAAELVARGWHVVGTVRDTTARTPLHELAENVGDQLGIEQLDIDDTEAYAPFHERLRERLAGGALDLLFVNAGTTRSHELPIAAVPTEDFVAVMTTNALSPMRVIESLDDLVSPTGLIGAMSSGQGSIANNTRGLRELYRGSKAALNMFLRSYAARQGEAGHRDRSFVLIAPGWIRTDLGGDEAPYTLEESVPLVVDVLLAQLDQTGIAYLDRFGQPVPW